MPLLRTGHFSSTEIIFVRVCLSRTQNVLRMSNDVNLSFKLRNNTLLLNLPFWVTIKNVCRLNSAILSCRYESKAVERQLLRNWSHVVIFCFNLILWFSGVYLPLLWEPSFCIRSPLALGYTRGHFSALVPLEPYSRLDGSASLSASNNIDDNSDHLQVTFLPLMDRERKMLPIHFLTQNEVCIRCLYLVKSAFF